MVSTPNKYLVVDGFCAGALGVVIVPGRGHRTSVPCPSEVTGCAAKHGWHARGILWSRGVVYVPRGYTKQIRKTGVPVPPQGNNQIGGFFLAEAPDRQAAARCPRSDDAGLFSFDRVVSQILPPS